MIISAHVLLFSQDPEADRKLFSEVLEFRSVDAGGGWLIFALPPRKLLCTPPTAIPGTPRSTSCATVLQSLIESLAAKNVTCGAIHSDRWGIRTTIPLPRGGQIGLYQPTHPRLSNSIR